MVPWRDHMDAGLYIYRSVRFQRIKKADYKESKLVYQTTPAPEIKNITHTHTQTHTHTYIYILCDCWSLVSYYTNYSCMY